MGCDNCCQVVTWSFDAGGWVVKTFDSGVRLLTFVSIVYWWVKLTKSRDRLIPFYFNVLVWAALNFFVLFFVRILPFPDSTFWTAAYEALNVACIAVMWWVQVLVVAFMRERTTESAGVARAMRNTALFLLPFLIVHTVFSFQKNGVLGQLVVEIALVLTFGVLSGLYFTGWRDMLPRPAAREWSIFLFTSHALFLWADLAAVTSDRSEMLEQTACSDIVSMVFYYVVYAPLLYRIILQDSDYWRSRGTLLLAEGATIQRADGASSARASTWPGDLVELREIPFQDLVVGECVGRGQYALVYKGTWQSIPVAVKKMTLGADIEHELIVDDLMKESNLLSTLRHENVLKFFGVSTVLPNLCIVTEYMERGSLFDMLHKRKDGVDAPSWERRFQMMKDIAAGMQYLHACDPPVTHRDLKSHNALVNNDWVTKIADFGVSREVYNTAYMTKVGTPHWMAPEVIRDERYSQRADVYSFGVVAWELITVKKPYEGIVPSRVMFLVAAKNQRPDIPEDCPPGLKSLLEKCWRGEPSTRPPFSTIVSTLSSLGVT